MEKLKHDGAIRPFMAFYLPLFIIRSEMALYRSQFDSFGSSKASYRTAERKSTKGLI